MKTCPTCERTFEETLTFCLVDGSVLSAPDDSEQTFSTNSTPITAPPKTAVMYPATRLGPAPMPTMVASEPPSFYPAKPQAPLEEKRSGKSWVVMAVAIPLVLIFVVGAIGGLIWLGKEDAPANRTDTKVTNINAKPSPTAREPNGNDTWEPRNYKASLNGERLTYYPGTTADQCQTDCDKDEACKAFTYIRAGAYNPNDSPMCYQLSVVTGTVSHACCISAIKR